MFGISAEQARELRPQLEAMAVGKEVIPIVQYDTNPRFAALVEQNRGKMWVGSVAGAGHMPPYGVTEELLTRLNITRNAEGAVDFHIPDPDAENGYRIDQAKIEEFVEALKPQPTRFLDTPENIAELTNTLYNEFARVYKNAADQGAEKVLYSVCSVSPGYDICHLNALFRLMDEVGPEHIAISVFLPVSEEAVGSYSFAATNGLNADTIWIPEWQKILFMRTDPQYENSIFLNAPHLIPYYEDDIPGYIPNDKETHARGKQLTGNGSTSFSNVNLAMTLQALDAVTDANGVVYTDQILGYFGETFQAGAKNYIGGAPEVMMMLIHAGVPLENITQIVRGMYNPQYMDETTLLKMYHDTFEAKLTALDELLPAFGEKPLRRTSAK